MEPVIHQWYSVEEAVVAFGGGAAELLCDGQFAVLPEVVLCFVTVQEASERSHMEAPRGFVWRPGRMDYEPGGKVPWLPQRLRDAWDHFREPGVKLQEYRAFLRSPSDDRFLYCGHASLTTYGERWGTKRLGPAAEFSIREKPPREAWVRFGGYPGWLVEVNHKLHRVAPGDLRTFEQLVEEMPRQEFSHLCMTRYEEDSLHVHTNARRGWLMYLRHPMDAGMYVQDRRPMEGPDDEEEFRCSCGIDLSFPRNQTLPRREAMRVAVELFETGQVPKWVQWWEQK